MTYGPEERVWKGETCHICGRELHGECSKLDEKYFCGEGCLGAYLLMKYEDDIQWVDFITEEALRDRWQEDSKMGGWD